MKLKQIQLRVPLHGPARPNANPVLPRTACLSSPLPCLYLCTAYNLFPQACQHPSTAEGNYVWVVFSSYIILWFVRTTGECMKCIHMQSQLRHLKQNEGMCTCYKTNQRGCNWNFCSKASCNTNHFRRQTSPPNMQLSKEGKGKNPRTHGGRFLTVQEVVLYPCSAVFLA